jgi:hypothetical protein
MSDSQVKEPQGGTPTPTFHSPQVTPKATAEQLKEGEAIVSALAQILPGKIDPTPGKSVAPDATPQVDEEQRRKEEEARKLEEAKKREAAKASEPARNNALNERTNKLQTGKFAVNMFRDRYNFVKVPKGNADAGFDEREKAREVLEADLTIAEAFKLKLPTLQAADTTVGKLTEELKNGFTASRPNVPTDGIATEQELKMVKANAGRIPAWADAVGQAPAYTSALQAFESAVSSRGAKDWPFTGNTRGAAGTAAQEAASKGQSLDGACKVLTDATAVIDASGPYAVVRKRVGERRAKIQKVTADVADYGIWLDGLLKDVTGSDTLSITKFNQQAQELTEAEAAIQPFTDYIAALATTRAAFDEVKRLVTPNTKAAAAKGDSAIETEIKAALTEGNGFYFDKASGKLKDATALIEAARKDRGEAVRKHANSLLNPSGSGKATADKLADAKDLSGNDLVTELYLQFGEASFAPALNGFKASADTNATKAAEVAAEKLKVLGASLGAKGIKALTEALGVNPGAGAGELGALMQHGMVDEQVTTLHKEFDLGQPTGQRLLKDLYGTSFRGKPEAFAKIVGTGMKMPDDKGTEAVGRAANMAKTFGNPADLREVVDGLCGQDGAIRASTGGLNTDQQKKLGTEQCDAAAKRMGDLLQIHFNGDATKLKKMFDVLKGYPDREKTSLQSAQQASNNYQALPPQQKKTQTAPPPFTTAMGQRLNRLNNVGGGKPPLQTLIRNAASMKMEGTGGKFAGKETNALSAERLEHFGRHTRSMNSFQPPDLASETTPINDPEDKPASFWPEGTDAAVVKSLVIAARNKAGKPPGAWTQISEDIRDWFYPTGSQGKFQRKTRKRFFQFDTSVDYPLKVAGLDKTVTISVRLGAEILDTQDQTTGPKPKTTASTETTVTQFYPLSGANVDTLEFEDMQAVKAALGKRQIA